MLTDIQQEWVRRLRSGEIKQCTGNLGKSDGSRCCLGVAADIAVEYGIISPPVPGEPMLLYGDNFSTLPEVVWKWMGLRTSNGWIKDDVMFQRVGINETLSNLNDSGQYDFKAIADLIEKDEEKLFGPPPEDDNPCKYLTKYPTMDSIFGASE